MTLTVDNPILNSPFREPERYWLYDAAGMQRFENGHQLVFAPEMVFCIRAVVSIGFPKTFCGPL